MVTSITLNKDTQMMHNFEVPKRLKRDGEIYAKSLTIVRSPPIGSTKESVNGTTYDRHHMLTSIDHRTKIGQASIKTLPYPNNNMREENDDDDTMRTTEFAKSEKRYLKAKDQNAASNKSTDETSNLKNSEVKSPNQQTEANQSENESTTKLHTKKAQAKVNKAKKTSNDSRQKLVEKNNVSITEQKQVDVNSTKTTTTNIHNKTKEKMEDSGQKKVDKNNVPITQQKQVTVSGPKTMTTNSKIKTIDKMNQITKITKVLENKTKPKTSETSTSEKVMSKYGPIRKTNKIIAVKRIPKDPQMKHNANGIIYHLPAKTMIPSASPTMITTTPSKVEQLPNTRPPTVKITSPSDSNNISHEQTLIKVNAPTTFPTFEKEQENNSENVSIEFEKEVVSEPSSKWYMITTFSIALSPGKDKMMHKDVKPLTENVLKTLIGKIVSTELNIDVLIQSDDSFYRSRSSQPKNSGFVFISYDIDCTGIEDILTFEPVLWQEVSLCLKCSYTDVGTAKDGDKFRSLFNQKIQGAFSSTIEDGRFLSTIKKSDEAIIAVSEAGNEKDIYTNPQNRDSNKNISENGNVRHGGKYEKLSGDGSLNKTFRIGWIMLV